MASFPWNALPLELQTVLLHSFDLPTLGKACSLSKAISAQATPIFWASIDLKTIRIFRCEDCNEPGCSGGGRWDLEEKLQSFFLTCHFLQQTRPTRWQELAAHVKRLRLVKVPAMHFRKWLERAAQYDSDRLGSLEHDEWPFPTPQDLGYYEGEPTIWDVICNFESLEELNIYNQQNWESDIRTDELAHKMQGALPRLKKLKIGGDVSKELMSALLLGAHQTLEDLSCIALVDGTVGQDYHSRGLLHLGQVSSKKSFPKLRSLHLCKLAELAQSRPEHEDESRFNEESGMPWQWEESDDLDSLQDWAAFIHRVSANLQSLTLEDCYLVGHKFRDRTRLIDPGNAYSDFRQEAAEGPQMMQDHQAHLSEDSDESEHEERSRTMERTRKVPDPAHWGAASRRRFRETLFPVLAEQAWPQLQRLVLVGLALPGEGVESIEAEGPDLKHSLANLRSFLDRLSSRKVDVELRPAGIMTFNYDATPLQITPSGSWHGE